MALIQAKNNMLDLLTISSSEASIMSGSWYQKLNQVSQQAVNTQVVDTFQQFYDRSIVDSIESSRRLLNYFDPVKMAATGNENKCNAIRKIFSINKKYDEFLLDKQVLHSILNTQLNIVKNRIMSSGPQIIRKLQNNDFQDFPNFQIEINECTKTMSDCSKLNHLFRKDRANSSFSTEEEEHIGALLRLNNNNIDLNVNNKPIEEQKEKINLKQQEFYKIGEEKLLNQYDFEYNNNRKEYFEDKIKSNKAIISYYEEEINSLRSNVNASENRKKLILENCNSEERLAKFLNEILERRKKFDENFAANLLASQQVNEDLVYDIKNLKEVNKSYHIIFLLDKSGSMRGQFDAVINSTQTVIKKRAALPITNDIVSIIKFNDMAVIEVQNVSVKDSITITNDVGGGTSFCKPLSKLEEILNEINFEITTPLVFFLSDGDGESKQTVYNKCREVKNSVGSGNIIFFSVGFGESADSECLSEMAKIFNNGTTTLKIGNDKCPLYNKAQNESELTRVFTLFEKLFNYQQNLIKTKQDLLKGVYQKKQKQYEKNREALNDLEKESIRFVEEQKKYATSQAYSQDDIRFKYEESIKKNEQFIKSVEQTNDNLNSQIKQCQENLAKLEPKKIELQNKYEKCKKELDDQKSHYDKLQTFCNEQIELQLNQLRELTDSNTYLKDLVGYGVSIDLNNPTEFEFIYRNFSKDYYKLKKMLREKVLSSVKVDGEYEKVINKLINLNNCIQELKNIAETLDLDLKMWELIVNYYKKCNLIDSKEINDQENLSNILQLKSSFDENKQAAFETLLSTGGTVSEIFTNLNRPNYIDDFINELSDSIRNRIRQLERESLVVNENDKDRIRQITDRLNMAIDESYELQEKRQDIRFILNAMLQIRNEIRAKYIQSTIGNELKSCLNDIMDNYFPSIDSLDSTFRYLTI